MLDEARATNDPRPTLLGYSRSSGRVRHVGPPAPLMQISDPGKRAHIKAGVAQALICLDVFFNRNQPLLTKREHVAGERVASP